MSFTDQLMVWFHIAFVIFTIGPVTIATMSTPRYIRRLNLPVLRYLARMTRIFGAASLGVLLFGIIAGQALHDMSKVWVTVSMTLFVVALVLLVLIMRDQRRAIAALDGAALDSTAVAGPAGTAVIPAAEPAAGPESPAGPAEAAAPAAPAAAPAATAAPAAAAPAPAAAAAARHLANVERGRIASMAGVVSLIWLVILVLMVWQP